MLKGHVTTEALFPPNSGANVTSLLDAAWDHIKRIREAVRRYGLWGAHTLKTA
jgi:hypothetical protein